MTKKKVAANAAPKPNKSRRNPDLVLASNYAKAKQELAQIDARLLRHRRAIQVDDNKRVAAEKREKEALAALTGVPVPPSDA